MKFKTITLKSILTLTVYLVPFCLLPNVFAGNVSDLDGVWIQSSRVVADRLEFTPAGAAAKENYDYLNDDPAMQCIPASITRVMMTPSPPLEIKLHNDHIEINYEFMDVKRHVPLTSELAVEDAPYAVKLFPHLGRSVARYDNDTLVINTTDLREGVLTTLMGFEGLAQSGEMRTEERYIPDGDSMTITITHHDPVNYVGPMIMTYTYTRIDSDILEWGCVPDKAGYDQYKQ